MREVLLVLADVIGIRRQVDVVKHQYGTPSFVKNSNAASTFASAVASGDDASHGNCRVPGPNGSCPALQKVCQ